MGNLMSCTCSAKWRDEVYALLRVVTGLAFFNHGYMKVFVIGTDGVTGFFSSVGVPMANIVAFLVSYGELLGGIALMLGFLTHWIAKMNVVILLGAIGFVHWGAEGGWFNGYGAQGGYEYPLLLLVVCAVFLVHGAGKYSLDAKYAAKRKSEMMS